MHLPIACTVPFNIALTPLITVLALALSEISCMQLEIFLYEKIKQQKKFCRCLLYSITFLTWTHINPTQFYGPQNTYFLQNHTVASSNSATHLQTHGMLFCHEVGFFNYYYFKERNN